VVATSTDTKQCLACTHIFALLDLFHVLARQIRYSSLAILFDTAKIANFSKNWSQICAKIVRQGKICEKLRFCSKRRNSRKNCAPQDRDFLQKLSIGVITPDAAHMHCIAIRHRAAPQRNVSGVKEINRKYILILDRAHESPLPLNAVLTWCPET